MRCIVPGVDANACPRCGGWLFANGTCRCGWLARFYRGGRLLTPRRHCERTHFERDTVGKVRSILSGIFTYAIGKGHFPARSDSDNPAHRALIPESATEPGKPQAAARGEVKGILAALKEMPLERAAVAIMAMLGTRPGEARGLRWEDWDRVKAANQSDALGLAHHRRHDQNGTKRATGCGQCGTARGTSGSLEIPGLADRRIHSRGPQRQARKFGQHGKAHHPAPTQRIGARLARVVFLAPFPRYCRPRRVESRDYFAGSREFKGSRG